MSKLVLKDHSVTWKFNDYFTLLLWLADNTFECCTNVPEEYDALDADQRTFIDAVHDAYMKYPHTEKVLAKVSH